MPHSPVPPEQFDSSQALTDRRSRALGSLIVAIAVAMVSVVSVMHETSGSIADTRDEATEPRLLSGGMSSLESRAGSEVSTRESVDTLSSAPNGETDLIEPERKPAATPSPAPESTLEPSLEPAATPIMVPVPTPASTPAPVAEGPAAGATLAFSAVNILGIDVEALSRSGPAYERIVRLAGENARLDYGDNTGPGNDVLIARALLGDRAGVLEMVRAAKGTLTSSIIYNAAARNLAATAIALNVVGAREEDAWLRVARDMAYDGGQHTLADAALRANNHGSAADQSLIAIDLHLNDRAHLEGSVIPVVRQRLGDDMGIELRMGDSIQEDPENPVAIGLPGTFAQGVPLDGLLLEEQRRESGFPNCGGYNFGASGQILLSVWLLEAAGYPAQEWGQRALHRVFDRLMDMGCTPEGDDRWQGDMYNALTGRYVVPEAVGDGKTLCCTDYLFAGR